MIEDSFDNFYAIRKSEVQKIWANRDNPDELVKIANDMYLGVIPAYALRNKDSKLLEIE